MSQVSSDYKRNINKIRRFSTSLNVKERINVSPFTMQEIYGPPHNYEHLFDSLFSFCPLCETSVDIRPFWHPQLLKLYAFRELIFCFSTVIAAGSFFIYIVTCCSHAHVQFMVLLVYWFSLVRCVEVLQVFVLMELQQPAWLSAAVVIRIKIF